MAGTERIEMFYYGQYKSDRVRNSRGIESCLSNYEKGAIERGMCFIAFSQTDLYELMGWRHFICGSEIESLQMECQRFWNNQTRCILRGKWEIRRLDHAQFMVSDMDAYRPREIISESLIFG